MFWKTVKKNSTTSLPQVDSKMTSLSYPMQKQRVEKNKLRKGRFFLPVLVAFSSLFLSTGASYAESYVGAWRKGSDAYALYQYNNWTSFTSKWKQLGQQNLRLVDMEVKKIGNTTKYVGVWRKGSDGYALYRFDSWSKLTKKWQELAKQNLRLVDIEVEKFGIKTYYYGVWRKGSDKYALYSYDS